MPRPFGTSPPRWLIPLLGFLVAFGPLSIDMYLPALPTMTLELHTTQSAMQYTLGVFFAGFCIGMLFYGPLSDRFGRRRLLISGMALFVLASALCTQVQSVEQLIILRGLQAFGSGAAVVMARAIARDVYSAKQLPHIMSLMTLVTMAGPLLAPLVGGGLLTLFNWQAIFYLLTLLGLICTLLMVLAMPETLSHQQQQSTRVSLAFRNYCGLLRDREAMATIGTLAFSFAGMFAFISGSPFVYIDYFQVPAGYYGLLFGCNILGMIVVLLINVRLLRRYRLNRLLLGQAAAQLVFGVLLFALHRSSLVPVVVAVVLYMSLINAVGSNSIAQLLQTRGEKAGSASALAVALQFGMGALGSLAVSLLQDSTPFAMTLVMAVCALLSVASQWVAVNSGQRPLTTAFVPDTTSSSSTNTPDSTTRGGKRNEFTH